MSDRLDWVRASGRGTVHTFTVVHRTTDEFSADLPFPVGLVDLEEGIRMMARLDVREPVVGMPVEVFFERVDDQLSLPHFKEVEE
jgi:uncharacterized OB-fold protein